MEVPGQVGELSHSLCKLGASQKFLVAQRKDQHHFSEVCGGEWVDRNGEVAARKAEGPEYPTLRNNFARCKFGVLDTQTNPSHKDRECPTRF